MSKIFVIDLVSTPDARRRHPPPERLLGRGGRRPVRGVRGRGPRGRRRHARRRRADRGQGEPGSRGQRWPGGRRPHRPRPRVDDRAPAAGQAEVDLADYAAVFYPGGHGPMEDLAVDADSGRLLTLALESGKPLGVVCHGPACAARRDEGGRHQRLRGLPGLRVHQRRGDAGRSRRQGEWLLQDRLVEAGVDFQEGEPWAPKVIVPRTWSPARTRRPRPPRRRTAEARPAPSGGQGLSGGSRGRREPGTCTDQATRIQQVQSRRVRCQSLSPRWWRPRCSRTARGGRRARDEPCGVGDSEDDGRGVDGQASTVRPGQRDEHDAEDRRQQDDHVGRPFHRPAERGTQPSSRTSSMPGPARAGRGGRRQRPDDAVRPGARTAALSVVPGHPPVHRRDAAPAAPLQITVASIAVNAGPRFPDHADRLLRRRAARRVAGSPPARPRHRRHLARSAHRPRPTTAGTLPCAHPGVPHRPHRRRSGAGARLTEWGAPSCRADPRGPGR